MLIQQKFSEVSFLVLWCALLCCSLFSSRNKSFAYTSFVFEIEKKKTFITNRYRQFLRISSSKLTFYCVWLRKYCDFDIFAIFGTIARPLEGAITKNQLPYYFLDNCHGGKNHFSKIQKKALFDTPSCPERAQSLH